MKNSLNILRFLSRHAWWWTVAFVIFLAVTITAARIFLPQLGQYRTSIEMQVSQALGQPVSIGEFEVRWHGKGPRLLLHDVRLLDRAGEQELLGFDELSANVSVPGSLFRGKLHLQALTLSGFDVSVVRHKDGRYTLQGFGLPQGQENKVGGEGSQAVFAWLFSQSNLAIKESDVRWHDQALGRGVVEFKDVSLHLQNSGLEHRLAGVMQLPSTMGGSVEVIVDALGEAGNLMDWQSEFYIKADQLQLTQWLVDEPALGAQMLNGVANIELWGSEEAARLQTMKTRFEIMDLSFAAAQGEAPLSIPLLAADMVWQGDADQWALDVDRFQFVRGDKEWPLTRFKVLYQQNEADRAIEVATSFARIEDLAELILNNHMTPEKIQELLEEIKPRGDVSQALIKFRPANLELQQPLSFAVRAKIDGLAVKPWKKVPGINRLDVVLNMDQFGGVASLQGQGLDVDTRGLFRDRLKLKTLQGQIDWQKTGKEWRVELSKLALANDDAALTLDGQIDLPGKGRSAVVKLFADIERANAAATSTYLPVKVMPSASVSWLDEAIVSGKVTSGAMVLQGPIKQFPFEDGSGSFEVRLNVENGVLDYTKGWPRLEQLDAEIAFVGRSLNVTSSRAKIFSTDVGPLTMNISSMRAKPVVIELQGEAMGATQDVVRFLNESPLRKNFGQFTEGALASGNSRLDLSLNIPLQANARVATHGAITFDDSNLDIKRLGIDLENIVGRVEFTAAELVASDVAATVMGQPLQIDIRTDDLGEEGSLVVFNGTGKTSLASLAQRVSLPVFPFIEGDALWQVQLDVPQGQGKASARPSLRINSDLKGVALNLPAPLEKSAVDSRPLLMFAEFGDEITDWRFDYGQETLTGIVELRSGSDGQEVNRGEFHFAGLATLPDAEGLRIAGELAHFDLDQWWPVLFEQPEAEGDEASLVSRVELKMVTAQLFGQSVHDFDIKADRLFERWSFDVSSPEFAGHVSVPHQANALIEMDLQQFHIKSSDEDEGDESVIDPRTLPSLRINSEHSSFNGVQYGSLALLTKRLENGLRVESMQTHGHALDINLTGRWTQTGDQQETALDAILNIHNLGSMLGGLGYVETFKHGEGVTKLNLSWLGPAYDPDLGSLSGKISMDINDGRLLEVDPGAGRLFGLLSVQALPRRLTLDFSDFFGKGFAFDYMRGQFNLSGGNAVTEDFRFNGPSAMIDVKGRAGLVARDYDQQVKVVPHVTSGIPLLVGITSGWNVGAVWLVVEKLFKPKIDKATEIFYHVTGSWDDPQLKQLD